MSQPRSAPPDLPGFSLVEGIGGGGFADVFLYEQEHPRRPVAVKILRAEHLSSSSLRQFATEADVMAQVSAHPYIVTIYTSGVAPDGRPYIVMEHYPQPHFGLRARGGRLAVAEVLRVGVQVASAVETAHRAGILHRDIKPANILTSAYGRPGLTDFGISGVRDETGVEAAAGVTVAFSSPEVLLDDEAGGTEVSDVYSLCATMFSLLAGHSPFWVPGGDNSEHAVLSRAVSGHVPRLERADVPASLSHLLANGMATDPNSRPPSALALARALQSIEQELAFAPTPLEIRDDLAGAPQPLAQTTAPGDEDDGTRRATPRVVNPEGLSGPPATPPMPSSQAAAIRAVPAPSATPTPTPTPPAESSTFAVSTGSEDERLDTVVRRSEKVNPPPPTPTGGPGARGSRQLPPWPVLAAGGGAVAVGLLVAGMLFAKSAETPQPPPTTEKPTNPAPNAITGAPSPPSDIAATVTGDGVMTVTFTKPGTGAAGTYRFTRTGPPWPDGLQYFDSTDSPASITGLAPGELPCFTAIAYAANGRVSDPTTEACATPAPPAPTAVETTP